MPKKPTNTGRLRIGDQWNAITILARSQTHPLKAVCEMVENSIDAQAQKVHIIRKRHGREHLIEVWDDGNGVKRNEQGIPDFEYVATHICDSIKRRLDERDKFAKGIHGEFGIGLLGFWSLGSHMRMISAAQDGMLYELTLHSGKNRFEITPLRRDPLFAGTHVEVGPLNKTVRHLVSGEKMQKYFALELRDRLRISGAELIVDDRIAHRHYPVVPKAFAGEPLSGIACLETPYGRISVELYFAQPGEEAPKVSLAKDGTRVKSDLSELEGFDHPPWTNRNLEGVIDCPFVDLTPGTRDSVIHNEKLAAFVSAMARLETHINTQLEEREKAASERASQTILRDVKRAILSAIQELPKSEYLWFDIEEENVPGQSPGGDGLPTEVEREKRTVQTTMFPEMPGPLAFVRVSPKATILAQGREKKLTACGFDEKGTPITSGIEFHWSLESGPGSLLETTGETVRFISHCVGVTHVIVTGSAMGLSATGESKIRILEEIIAPKGEPEGGSGKGLPRYRLTSDPGTEWRSRYLPEKNVIEINSGHRDYMDAREKIHSLKKYISKLYAKEIVLLNFPDAGPSQAMERLIELVQRTERVL